MKKLILFCSMIAAFGIKVNASCVDMTFNLISTQCPCVWPGDSAVFEAIWPVPALCALDHYTVTDPAGQSQTYPASQSQFTVFYTGPIFIQNNWVVTAYDNTNTVIGVRGFGLNSNCTECPSPDFFYHNVDCPVTSTVFQNTTNASPCHTNINVTYDWNFGDPLSGPNNISHLLNPSHYFTSAGSHNVVLTVTYTSPYDTCVQSWNHFVNPGPNFLPLPAIQHSPANAVYGSPITFTSNPPLNVLATIYFGDGSSSLWDLSLPINHTYSQIGGAGFYNITVVLHGECEPTVYTGVKVDPSPVILPCQDCIGSFNPEPGKKYLLSAWVKEESPPLDKTQLTFPSIVLNFDINGGGASPLQVMSPKGEIIDGWERIEEEFIVPANADHINIKMACTTGNCFFDDIRIFPFDGTMKTFVYDPVNLRLAAELDERNYATLYEYDEEGKLIRIKKETEKGKMTIQENRNNTSKN